LGERILIAAPANLAFQWQRELIAALVLHGGSFFYFFIFRSFSSFRGRRRGSMLQTA